MRKIWLLLLLLVPLEASAFPSCEATGGAICLYIDAATGSDSNAGTGASPFLSFKNVSTYFQESFEPAQHVSIAAGDFIYVAGGTYSVTMNPGSTGDSGGGGTFIYYTRNKHGTASDRITIKAYDGETPILDPGGAGIGMNIFQSSFFTIEEITIDDALQRGISIEESDETILEGVTIRNTDGVDNNNVSGLYSLSADVVRVSNSTFHDNYDRTAADTGGNSTGNSSNVVFFGGTDVTFNNNILYQTPDVTAPLSGGCLKYKHSTTVATGFFNVYENVISNCKHYALQTGTANTHFHHNIVDGGVGIDSDDFGGVTHQTSQIFEFNTFYNISSIPIAFTPVDTWINGTFPNDPTGIIFRNNIVWDTASSYTQANNIVRIGNFMSDAEHAQAIAALLFTENCYHNPNTAVILNFGAAGGDLGDTYTFTEWKAEFPLWDQASVEDEPLFVDAINADFQQLATSPCLAMGAIAGAQSVNPSANLTVGEGFNTSVMVGAIL